MDNTTKGILINIVAIIAIIILCCHMFTSCGSSSDSSITDTTVNIPIDKLTDTNTIQLELDTNKQNAKEIVNQIQEVSTGEKEPIATFTVPSTTAETAVEVVQEKIRYNDTTLPEEALEKTDNTIVSTDSEGTKVEVYKINTYRNWEAGVGIGKLDDKTYIPIALQRNYDRCHSVELQANLDTNGHVEGGQVMWKVHF
jgi:hypothetical protein